MNFNPSAPGAIPAPAPVHSDGPPPDAVVAMAEAHLRELGEMRAIGMRHLRNTEDDTPRDGKPLPSKASQWAAFNAMSKAVRQIMALEQEIIGLRDKRIQTARTDWMKRKADTVRQSVIRSIDKAHPQLARPRREGLLNDLFSDYRAFANGNIRDLIEEICKTLGITPDLTLWDEPQPASDIALPEGPKWVVPANGEKPYTVVTTPSGMRKRVEYDSPHIERHANGPPEAG